MYNKNKTSNKSKTITRLDPTYSNKQTLFWICCTNIYTYSNINSIYEVSKKKQKKTGLLHSQYKGISKRFVDFRNSMVSANILLFVKKLYLGEPKRSISVIPLSLSVGRLLSS